MVSTKALQEFKQIYKDEYGTDLDDQIALDKAERFLMLMRAIYRPIPKNSPFLKGGNYGSKVKPKNKS